MRPFDRRRREEGCIPLVELPRKPTGTRVRVAGIRIASRRHRTQKGDPMGFLTLEDETGTAEVVLFPEAWRRAIRTLFRDGPVLVDGTVDVQHGAVTVTGERVGVWGAG